MSNYNILYERCILYSAGGQYDIGTVYVRLINFDETRKVVALIEPRSTHNPLEHIEEVLRILDIELFQRARIDMHKSVDIIFDTGSKGVRMVFHDTTECSYHFEDVDQDEFNYIRS